MRESNLFPIVFMCAGAASLIGGISWIYVPAGLVAAGLMLLALGYCGRRGGV